MSALVFLAACGGTVKMPGMGVSDPTSTTSTSSGSDMALASADAADSPTTSPIDLGPPTTHTPKTLLSIPPAISAHANDLLVTAGYLDVTLYGAKGDGKTDDTKAIQAVIDDAGVYSMTTYVPAGTYLVSGTITGTQLFNGVNMNVDNAKYGANLKYGGLRSPSLVGPAAGARPTIVLADNTFTDASNPQPVLHLVDNCGAGPITDKCAASYGPAVGNFAEMFSAVVVRR